MAKKAKERPIKLGVLGIGRGQSFMGESAEAAGFELAALCDQREDKVKEMAAGLNVAAHTDFDKFLEHDIDAVVVANYFHQHAPFAIKALNAGKHVMSECAACHTLGEGVELTRAVEKTKKTYMFAENYAYMLHNQELRRVFQTGEFGSFMYGEGEYVHPGDGDWGNSISLGTKHWRNWLPATYYSTHSLSPIMFITETRPEKVNGFVIRGAADDPAFARRPKICDAASMIALRMDNGAVVKLLQVSLRGHRVRTEIRAARGFLSGQDGQVRLAREQFHEKLSHPKDMTYTPNFPEMDEAARKTGHGGGDFFMMSHFARAIRTGEPPFLDVYRGVDMSIVGIQAWRSALNDSNTEIIPDFRRESVRKKYENDDWSPDPERRKPGQPPCSIDGEKTVSPEALEHAKRVWSKLGYTGE